MEQKLNKVLQGIENLTIRWDKLDAKIDSFSLRLTKLEKNFDEQSHTLTKNLETKADRADLIALDKKIEKIVTQQNAQEVKEVMQESYDKRLNVLLHGIEEEGDSVWETRDVTLQKIHDFMKEGLQIVDLTSITLTDYHRLPQQPVYRNNCKVNRPIIVKLCNSNDKHLFFSKLKNFKQYNESRKMRDLKPHYITDHLPKLFQQERKSLLPYFKQARRMQQKTVWRADNGHYCLFVDGVKVNINS